MLKKYKTQLESEKNDEKQANADDSMLKDNNNKSSRQYDTIQTDS